MTLALWALYEYIDDSRINTAQDYLSKAADEFRDNDLSRGMDYLDMVMVYIEDLISDYVSQIPGWLYNELVDLLNEPQEFIDQYS